MKLCDACGHLWTMHKRNKSDGWWETSCVACGCKKKPFIEKLNLGPSF